MAGIFIPSDLENFEERFIQINGIKLHTVITGKGDPVILLHGFPDFWFGWKKIMVKLKDEFQLIAPDLKGFNLSDKPTNVKEYGLELLVEDVKTLALQLGLQKFSLAGHDWGGVIAWAFAEKYPTLLDKLIILNAPHYKIFQKKIQNNKTQKRASGYISQLIKPNSDQLLKKNNFQMLQFAVFENARKKDAFSEEDREKYMEAWSQPGALQASVNYYRANRRYDDWSGVIDKVPTLVLFGMKDTFIKPTVLEGLSEYVKDLKIIKDEESSHWVIHDNPDFVSTNIRDFLRK
ncbi:MAG: Soluble epoxide hydrolase [Promethearchaeota archaeon]|nr:MAG: Soluble epoxide hydrolase [Candidatus Lokiarchaeota archaeon]